MIKSYDIFIEIIHKFNIFNDEKLNIIIDNIIKLDKCWMIELMTSSQEIRRRAMLEPNRSIYNNIDSIEYCIFVEEKNNAW